MYAMRGMSNVVIRVLQLHISMAYTRKLAISTFLFQTDFPRGDINRYEQKGTTHKKINNLAVPLQTQVKIYLQSAIL